MQKDNKIINYLKENYKLMIPIALMVVVFIAAIVYYKVTIFDNFTKENEDKFYQWFYDKKIEYNGVFSTNRRNEIVGFKAKEKDIQFDSTPIYFQNKEKVIFPSVMSIVMPTLNCAEYYANKYSYITNEKDNNILTTEKYNNRLGHYFLFDGYDLYFFIDEVKLNIDKNTSVTLSPLSYVKAKSGSYLSYYDKKTDTYKTINSTNNSMIVENNYYKVNVITDSIEYYGTDVILTGKVNELNPIKMKDNL